MIYIQLNNKKFSKVPHLFFKWSGLRENGQYDCLHGRIKAREISFSVAFLFLRKGNIMSWIYLLIAGLFEITWAVGLKLSEGFTHPVSSTVTVIGMVACYYFLALSLKEIPLGTAYAVWTGIGTAGTVILGIILFKEPVSLAKFVCFGMILCGITGLKLLSA